MTACWGGWWLVVGGWWLVVGGWWLVVGGWWRLSKTQTGGGGGVCDSVLGWLVVGGWWLVVGGWWEHNLPERQSARADAASLPKQQWRPERKQQNKKRQMR